MISENLLDDLNFKDGHTIDVAAAVSGSDIGWNDDALGALIVVCETGIYYTNQAAGGLCAHPRAEGMLLGVVPLPDGFAEALAETEVPHAPPMRSLYNEWLGKMGLQLDRLRIKQSMEAWAHVVPLDSDPPLRVLTKARPLILCWDNSD